MLDFIALLVLLVLLVAIVAALGVLGALPGYIARNRNHPQAEAINAAGWVGLIFGGVLWPLALIWAYTKPVRVAAAPASIANEGRKP